MRFQVPSYGALVVGLIAMMPTSVAAQSLLSAETMPCHLAGDASSWPSCRPPADPVLPWGSTLLVTPDGDSTLVESIRVVGTLGLEGLTVRVIGGNPVVAQSGRDVLTTGSIGSNHARR